MPMTAAAFSQKLVIEGSDMVYLSLRAELQAIQQKRGEAILDVNCSGNWVRGLEIVGGFVPFSVAKAVAPFGPVRPPFPEVAGAGSVTYDPEADAAFFYLEYAPGFLSLSPAERADLQIVSHSINPAALYGLDEIGGLVWIRIPLADVGPVNQFLKQLRR